MFRASWNRLHWWLCLFPVLLLFCICFASHSIFTFSVHWQTQQVSEVSIANFHWKWVTCGCFIAPDLFECERPFKVDWFSGFLSAEMGGFIAACLQPVFLLLPSWSAAFCQRLHFVFNKLTLIGCSTWRVYKYIRVCVCVDWLTPSRTPRECSPSYAYKQSLEILLTQRATTRRGVCVCVFINMCLCLWICLLHHTHTHTLHALCHAHFRAACFVTMRTLGLAWALFADWCFECLNWK